MLWYEKHNFCVYTIFNILNTCLVPVHSYKWRWKTCDPEYTQFFDPGQHVSATIADARFPLNPTLSGWRRWRVGGLYAPFEENLGKLRENDTGNDGNENIEKVCSVVLSVRGVFT